MKERMDWMNIARYFYLTDERLQQISRDFAADIERALAVTKAASIWPWILAVRTCGLHGSDY